MEFEAEFSPVRLILLFLLSFAFVIGGLWLTGIFGSIPQSGRGSVEAKFWMGVVAVFFFGWCCVAMLWRIKNSGLAIRIDKTGILAPRLFRKAVPWDHVLKAGSVSIKHSKFLGIEVSDPKSFGMSKMQSIMIAANRSLCGYAHSISMVGTNKSHGDLIDAVKRFAPKIISRNI